MDINTYSKLALRTANDMGDIKLDLLHAASGIAGESGEIIDIVKKYVFYKRDAVDTAKLVDELGDELWYINLMIAKLGVTWEQVLAANIAKLETRYPNLRFDSENAVQRDKAAEAAAQAAVGQ